MLGEAVVGLRLGRGLEQGETGHDLAENEMVEHSDGLLAERELDDGVELLHAGCTSTAHEWIDEISYKTAIRNMSIAHSGDEWQSPVSTAASARCGWERGYWADSQYS